MTQNFYTSFALLGKNLFLRGFENGERIQRKIPCQPSLYVPEGELKTEFTNLSKHPLSEIQFSEPKEAREYIKLRKASNAPIFGNSRFEYDMINEMYPGVEGLEVDSSLVRIVFLDIETECGSGFPDIKTANEKINAITIYSGGRVISFGLGAFDLELVQDENVLKYKDKIKYYQFDDETRMLRAFIQLLNKIDPDILTGWNSEGFDVPYIINRCIGQLGEEFTKTISPWKRIQQRNFTGRFGNEVFTYEIDGLEHIDYKELYRKFTYTQQESYSLGNILSVELGKTKVDFSEVASLHTLYQTNFQKFIEYNLWDVLGMVEMEEKIKLLDMIIAIAYRAKVNFSDVFTQVRMWDALSCNYLKNVEKILPSAIDVTHENTNFEGAYVKPPQVGFHKWVISVDLASLYPHLMIQYSMSPENKLRHFPGINPEEILKICAIGGLEEAERDPKLSKLPVTKALRWAVDNDACLSANGTVFKNTQGFLPAILAAMYNERDAAKKKMKQASKKVELITEILKARGEE